MHDYVLDTIEVMDAHTAVNTANIIIEILKEFHINKIGPENLFWTSDNGKNIVNAISQ